MTGGAEPVAAILEALEEEEGTLPPKKRLLVIASVECFAEVGFDAASTRMIAARAGVAEATIFRHFNTKKELLLRISRPVLNRLLVPAVANEALRLARDSGGDFRQFARQILTSRLQFADRYAPFVKIMLQEVIVNAELRGLLAGSIDKAFTEALAKALEGFRQTGQIPDIPVGQFLRMAISLVAGYYVTRSIFAPGEWDDASEIEGIIDRLVA